MKLIRKIEDFFYNGPVKNVPKGYRHCPACEGTGDYDSFINCLYCNGQGKVADEKAIKILLDLESKRLE